MIKSFAIFMIISLTALLVVPFIYAAYVNASVISRCSEPKNGKWVGYIDRDDLYGRPQRDQITLWQED